MSTNADPEFERWLSGKPADNEPDPSFDEWWGDRDTSGGEKPDADQSEEWIDDTGLRDTGAKPLNLGHWLRSGEKPSPTSVPSQPAANVTDLDQRRVRGEITRVTNKLGDLARDSGQRHDRLINSANYCFRLALGVGLDPAWVERQLEYACERNGYTQEHPGRTTGDIADARAHATMPQYLEDRPNPNAIKPDVTITEADSGDGRTTPGYTDFAALLAGGLPDPPAPDILPRTDDVCVFYRRKRNDLFGDPEDGKTMVVQAAVSAELAKGGNVLFLDLDNNGAAETAQRLIMLGVDPRVLADRNRFRHIEPEDADQVLRVVADCVGWATLVPIDCVGELLPMFRANSDSADDYTRVMQAVSAPLEHGGAAVILLDHQAKGQDSRAFGAGGTMAKRRAISGVSINLVRKQTFTPGKGGTAELWINKDRPGGLRRHCSGGEGRRQFAGTFILDPPDPSTGVAPWRVTTERTAPSVVAVDPVVERHYRAGVAIGGEFNTAQLAAKANGLPDGTPHTEAQKKAAQRAAQSLVEQGRFELAATRPMLRWRVSE